MAIYSFWIFDRHCNCIFDREWTLESSKGTINSKQNEEVGKLLFGMVYSLKSIVTRLSHSNTSNNVRTISTSIFKIHILSTASGLNFVFISDIGSESLSHLLHYIYQELYVPYVARNYLSPIDFTENDVEETRGQGTRKISNPLFVESVEQFLQPMVSK
ncbi:probable Trafficking protein particle complex subunit BET5 [Saccharomycodes ludwigii]|uniref:Trafficking protein particle complex subunit n=1 Tax=Saccharomycodes ludwigii TaxID=36035 RepID=A0A376B279_9ASCO|nr:hypothetical protein SCDLUD_004347 [Saccharomycodes ludwigii]KAH3900030.1 hypothetical protein SCDLUD_004347 [Saccharomycodes ludwigii]SSD58795.1 probable Trafficking protein particle complex subunit BET5 [Saccharomycodes ludwigii]